MGNTLQKLALFGLLSSFIIFNAEAQEKCGTMAKHDHLLKTDLAYRKNFKQSEDLIDQEVALKGARVQGTVLKVPVVVHVLHTGQAIGVGANISTDQIHSAITSLNNAYRKKAGTIHYGNGVDMEIEFCLAQKTPAGAVSTGINRINAALFVSDYLSLGVTDANEVNVKALSKWDNTRYYNIWVVSQIDGNGGGSGVQGYAYLAGSAPATVDGTIILHNAFGYDPQGGRNYNLKSYTNKNVTTIHELGHAFGLYHTFDGDDFGCPSNTNCATEGDHVCDTPPHERSNSNCVTGLNDCDGNSSRDLFIHNFMDYSSDDCQTEFTAGQSTRARAQLTSFRANLFSSANLIACGCNSNTAPIARFYGLELTPCPGELVTFVNESLNAPASYLWTFQGGTPATSTSATPSVSFTGSGPYNVSLKVSSAASQNNTTTKTGYISPKAAYSGTYPLTESFEGSFPPSGWQIESGDAVTTTWGSQGTKQWESRSIGGSGAGSLAAAINLYEYSSKGRYDDLVMPTLNLTGATSANLTFQVAYQNYSSLGSEDSLVVYASTNCGNSFTELYRKGGIPLSNGTTAGSSFTPSITSDWRLESIDLAAYLGQQVQLRFRSVNEYGNNIYIDDVNVTASGVTTNVQTAEKSSVKVFPNPTKDLVTIEVQDENDVTVDVMNTTGMQVMKTQKGKTGMIIDLSQQPQGMYILMIKTNKGLVVSRVVKSN